MSDNIITAGNSILLKTYTHSRNPLNKCEYYIDTINMVGIWRRSTPLSEEYPYTAIFYDMTTDFYILKTPDKFESYTSMFFDHHIKTILKTLDVDELDRFINELQSSILGIDNIRLFVEEEYDRR